MATHTNEEKQKAPGIYLGEQRITSISGPVSVCYLKPTDQLFQAYHERGVDLPLILLFGDSHYSVKGACSPCDDSDPHHSCVELTYPSFLHALDHLAETAPIDFFTESSDTVRMRVGNKVSLKRDGFLFGSFYQEDMLHCHHPLMRTQGAHSMCPTSSIRWHYADIRMMSTVIEGYLFTPVIDTLMRVNDVFKDKDILPVISLLKGHHIREGYHPKDAYYRRKALEWFNIHIPFWLMYTDVAIGTRAIVEETLTFLKDFRQDRESGIFKQLDAIPIPEWNDIDVLTDMITGYLLSNKSYIYLYKAFHHISTDRIKDDVLRYIISLHTTPKHAETLFLFEPSPGVSLKDIKQSLIVLATGILLRINSILMDLYTLLRMFKPPQQNVSSTLSLAFLGASHMESISVLLQQPLFGYQVAFSTHYPLPDPLPVASAFLRCQPITDPVHLEQDVLHHQQKRLQSPINIERMEQYRKRVQNVKQMRERVTTNATKKRKARLLSPVPSNTNHSVTRRPSSSKRHAHSARVATNRRRRKGGQQRRGHTRRGHTRTGHTRRGYKRI